MESGGKSASMEEKLDKYTSVRRLKSMLKVTVILIIDTLDIELE